MGFRLYSQDKVVIGEFALVLLATISFIGGVFTYLITTDVPVWNFFAFGFFILAKHWLEFYETYQDRRVLNMTGEDKLPGMCRRQAD